jgi:hypothetical protein
MKDLKQFIKTTIREYLNEDVSNETIFGHNYSDLLDNISNKDAGLIWVEPQEVLDLKL